MAMLVYRRVNLSFLGMSFFHGAKLLVPWPIFQVASDVTKLIGTPGGLADLTAFKYGDFVRENLVKNQQMT